MKNYIGNRFGRLVVLSLAMKSEWRNKNRHYVCKCDCGITKIISGSDLSSGGVNSCGCLKREKLSYRLSTHGNSNHPLYAIWSCMIARCENPNMRTYKRYGGKGIKVCDRWHEFMNFVADIGVRPSNRHSIDRIDGTKGYHPDNCRWATYKEQAMNRIYR